MGYYVFIYGTLREAEANAGLLKNAVLVSRTARTKGTLYTTKKYFPAMTYGQDCVYGDLYKVDDALLHQIDLLEGYSGSGKDNLYDRHEVKVTTDQKTVKAYTYVLADQNHDLLREKVQHQDWKVHQLLQQKSNILYFGYGSCMDHHRFQQAGVDHHFQDLAGRGELNGFSLKFAMKSPNGWHAADIVEDGGYVEGKVYRIQKAALDYLFKREGVSAGLYRPAVISLNINGYRHHNVLTFYVLNKHDEAPPSDVYATEILRGAEGTLRKEYIEMIRNKLKRTFNMEINV